MTITELQNIFETMLRPHLADVKVHVYKYEENSIAMDVVSDLYNTDSIVDRSHFLFDILRSYDIYQNNTVAICPVSFEDFENRKENHD